MALHQALEPAGRLMNGLGEGGCRVFGAERGGAGKTGFEAADLVPIARFFTIQVAQKDLNPKQVLAEALQRFRDDTLNPLNQLIVAADVVVAIDQNLDHESPAIPYPAAQASRN